MAQITLSPGENFLNGSPISGTNIITGRVGSGETVTVGGGNQTFDADFNSGGDRVILSGNASQYSVSRSGSTIILTGPNNTVISFPAPNPSLSTAQQPIIQFADASFALSSNTNGGFNILIGTQTVTAAPVPVGPVGPPPVGQTLNVTATDVTEGQTITYTFTLTQVPTSAVTINVATIGGTAVAGSDFTPVSTTITFAVGQTTQFLTVATTDDAIGEAAETVSLDIRLPAGVTLVAGADTVALITDNDAPVSQAFTLTTTNDTLPGGAAADRFVGAQDVNQPGKLLSANDVVSGGAGVDAIELTNAIGGVPNVLADLDFTNVTGIETLVTNYAQVQLGAQADKAEIVTVDTATRTDAANVAGAVFLGTQLDLTSDANGDGVADFNNVLNVTMANSQADVIRLSLPAAAGSSFNTGTTFTPIGGVAPIGAIDTVVFSANVGDNIAAFDTASPALAVQAQSEDGADVPTGAIARFDDEGISFTGAAGQLFDVRDAVSGAQRGQFAQVILGTSLNDSTAGGGNLAGLLTGASVYVNAGGGNDTVVGTAGVDFLVGGGGNDVLDGAAGNDSFIGGAGNDQIRGGAGIDILTDASATSAAANAGNDTYFFASGEFLEAEGFNDNGAGAGEIDTIQLGGVFNGVNTGDYATQIVDAQFTGKAGIEVLVTQIANAAGAEVTLGALAQAAGIVQVGTAFLLTFNTNGGTFLAPVLSPTSSFSDDDINAATYTVGLTVNGVFGTAAITTGTVDDTVNLFPTANFTGSVNLGTGNDTLNTGYALLGAGNLTLTGGAGTNDTITFGGALLRSTFGGTVAIINPLGAGFTGFETVVLRGGDAAVANTDASLADRSGTAVTYSLTNLTDANVGVGGLTINASTLQANVVVGLGNDNKLNGTIGNADVLGNETLLFNGGLLTAARFVTVTGGFAADSLSGGSGADTLNGGGGNDIIGGGAGLDTLNGGDGNDTFIFGNSDFAAGETVNGDAGNDILDVTNGLQITDAMFANKLTVETLVTNVTTGAAADLTAAGVGAEVVLGALAQASGIATVNVGRAAGADGNLFTADDILGSGDDDVNASAYTVGLTVNTGTGGVTTGSGNDTVNLFVGLLANQTTIIAGPSGASGPYRLGAGDDTLNSNINFDGATAGDLADGGAGSDNFVYGGNYVANGTARGTVGTPDSVNLGNSRIVNFETLTLRASDAAVAVAGAPVGGNDLRGVTTNMTVTIDSTAVTDNVAFTVNASAYNTGVRTAFGTLGNPGDGEFDGANANADTISFNNLILNANTLTALKSLNVTSGAGADQLLTGAGNDTIDAGAGNDAVAGGLGNDTILGGAGNDILTGDQGTFTFTGTVVTGITLTTANTGGRDTIDGGDGDDRILISVQQFNGDQDSINGGNGNDTLEIVGQMANEVIADVGFAGTDTNGVRRYQNIEEVTLVGAPGGTQFNFQAGFFSENAGIRTINLGSNTTNGSTVSVANFQSGGNTLNGGAANDILVGSQFNDAFSDGAGADQINAGGGADTFTMTGGLNDGADAFAGEAGDDIVNTFTSFTDGQDVLIGGAGSDTVNFGTRDRAAGEVGLTTINVNANIREFETLNLIQGRDAVDRATPTADTAGSTMDYTVNVTDASFAAGAATTTLAINGGNLRAGVVTTTGALGQVDGAGFVAGDENLIVNAGGLAANHALNVTGGASVDTITTGLANDTINGGGGNDTINAGGGNDTITGGEGSDIITGGAGVDTIILTESVAARDFVNVGNQNAAAPAVNPLGGSNGQVTNTFPVGANGEAPRGAQAGVESITGFQTGTRGGGVDGVVGTTGAGVGADDTFTATADVIDFGTGIVNSLSTSIVNGVVTANSVLGQALQGQASLLAAIQLIEQELQGGADAGVANAGVIAFTYTDKTTGITSTFIGEIVNNGVNGSENFSDIVQLTGVPAPSGLFDVDGGGAGTAFGIAI